MNDERPVAGPRSRGGQVVEPGPVGIEVHDTGPARPLGRAPVGFPGPGGAGDAARVRAAFTPATIVEACRHGIAPSPRPGDGGPWSSPDPRAVIVPVNLRVPRTLARALSKGRLYVSLDAAFERVLAACAEGPGRSWMTVPYRRALVRLHRLGWAHSFEAWTVGGELAGGLYGLNVGGLFSVEALFPAGSDASTIALVALAQQCRKVGVTLIDVRTITPELDALGAVAIPRAEYLGRTRALAGRAVVFSGRPGETDPLRLEHWALLNTSI